MTPAQWVLAACIVAAGVGVCVFVAALVYDEWLHRREQAQP